MKRIIQGVPYSRLYKLEVPRLATRVIEIVEKHDPETLKIKEVFDLLLAVQPQMDALKAPRGASPFTEQLTPLRRQLLMYVGAINNRLSIVVREDVLAQDKDVKIAKIFIKSYLHGLSKSKNEELISEKVSKFFMQIDQDEELETILSKFGFTSRLNDLRNVHASLQEILMKRLASTSKVVVPTPVLIKQVCNALTDMFLQIRVAQLKHNELDYSPLVDELNKLINWYRNLVNIRDGYNQRQAEKANEGDQSGETPEVNEPMESAGRMMSLNAGDERGREVGFQLEENEKAVAKSAKQTQLPPLNNED